MKKAIFAIISAIVLATGMAACGTKTDKGEEAAADIEAAMIEGREAARKFLNRPWKDTTELQSQLLEARAGQSKYVTTGRPRCAATYDSAFVSTLRTVKPDVARELEKASRK